MKTSAVSLVLATLVAGTFTPANADTVVYQPKVASNNYHDASLRSDDPYNPNYSGIDYHYIMNYYGSIFGNYAVQFDGLSAYIGGPEAVTSAVLTLQLFYIPATDSNPAPTLDVHTLTQAWANGATWFSNGLGSAWTTAGGTVGATPVASITPPTNPPPYSTSFSWDVTTAVSNWVAGVAPHNGFLVKWSAGSTFDRRWYFDGPGIAVTLPHWASLNYEPKLTIYTIPEPSALLLAGLAVMSLFSAQRFFRR